jgi:hypothetical protein
MIAVEKVLGRLVMAKLRGTLSRVVRVKIVPEFTRYISDE